MSKQLTKPERIPSGTYAAILADQDGVCAICKQPPDGDRNEGYKRFIPDIDASRRICGLLCRQCKWMIDWSGGDPRKLQRMGDYIVWRKSQAKP